jgi:hypothetical protein
MLKIPYKSRDLSMHVEVFDGKFYLLCLPGVWNVRGDAKSNCKGDGESPYSVMRSWQGMKLDSYLISG